MRGAAWLPARWPLRLQVAALVVAVSSLPLALWAYVDLRHSRERMLDSLKSLLEARADQIVREVDAFHRGYRNASQRLVRLPESGAFCDADPPRRAALLAGVQGALSTFPNSDAAVRGAALIDARGRVIAATEEKLVGAELGERPNVQAALAGREVISDPYISSPRSGAAPTVGYFAPLAGPDGVRCVAAIWVRAEAFWQAVRSSNEQAGKDSFAVIFDHAGIRIAHTYSEDIVFRPGGALPPAELEQFVAKQRFGARTRELLTDVRPFPEQFERARSAAPDLAVFRGWAPVNAQWNYGVARRFRTVDWTVFYMVPERAFVAEIDGMTRQRLALAAVIIAGSGVAGLLLAGGILRPMRSLARAARSLAAGDMSIRVPSTRADEMGDLVNAFNAMADDLQTKAEHVARANDALEARVRERTAALSAEVAERQGAEARLQAQLERLQLLDQITAAIAERLDLPSIYQVVIGSLEDRLPARLVSVLTLDAERRMLAPVRTGTGFEALAGAPGSGDGVVPVGGTDVARALEGQLVYEPDLTELSLPLARRLVDHGLHSMVLAPLRAGDSTFGLLLAARKPSHGFTSAECEFLRQLSAHVALAARQAQLHGDLQRAYDELTQSQQTVMQQERLRALGQMASGIAHDINNAISPIVLYTDELLERTPGLDERTRSRLAVIARAIDDVAATVARMREFYRQRDSTARHGRLQLNELVPQVVELTRARWSDMPQQRGAVIRLVSELHPALPEILGGESELREALINLIFNAVDAMPDGGVLTLRTSMRPAADAGADAGPAARRHRVLIEVSDTGVGMDEATRRRCLEPFFTTKGERGTGLGLAMVYGVAQRHDAVLEIDSRVDGGTTVRLAFAAPETVMAAAAEPVDLAPARPLRVLLVDDDPLILRSLRESLEGDGHAVVTADGGQAGLDALRDEAAGGFDAVVTDLGMPYVDGRRVALAAKARRPGLPVILLTGWGQRLIADGETPPGVDLVLGKPPKLRELRTALARLVPQPALKGEHA
ncbi:ATP-binding protein [Roseateles sp.]|uniref:ATP-binding protein n=1 Tax=Roseateles sp. TaxID=1971397 RepID=UPI0031DB2D15